MSREKILQESFLNGGNTTFVIDLYQHYLNDHNSVTFSHNKDVPVTEKTLIPFLA